MKKILLYLSVAIATFLIANYFTGCNVVNKSRSVEHSNVDSGKVTTSDSAHVIKNDSSSTSSEVKSDSTTEKHSKKKEITIKFDTTRKSFSPDNPYKFDIGGTTISTPQPIQSATIEDNIEDDSSSTIKGSNSKAVEVKSLDSSVHKSSDSTKVLKTSKTVKTSKESKSFPWEITLIGILALLVVGYIIYRKYF